MSLHDLGDQLDKNFNICDKHDLYHMKNIVQLYNGDDWINYIKVNNSHYNRHLVYNNKNFNIFIITWLPNQSSPIHNHPKNGCLLRMLRGELNENKYIKTNNKLQSISNTILQSNSDVHYINDKYSYHKVGNYTKNQVAVSLHVYSPPNFIPTYFNL
jgi:cysteine dioxygenase